MTVYSPVGTRSPSVALIALWAASTPASSVKWSSRVPVDQPEPLAALASTIAVRKLMMSVDSSVWARGMRVDATAIRSCRIVTSPPRMSPSRGSPASPPARAASFDEATKVRSAPAITLQPTSTRSRSGTSSRRGSW